MVPLINFPPYERVFTEPPVNPTGVVDRSSAASMPAHLNSDEVYKAHDLRAEEDASTARHELGQRLDGLLARPHFPPADIGHSIPTHGFCHYVARTWCAAAAWTMVFIKSKDLHTLGCGEGLGRLSSGLPLYILLRQLL